jgi:hypothetical protein
MNPDDWITNAGDFSNRVVPEVPGYSGNYALQLNSTGFARTKFYNTQHPNILNANVKTSFTSSDSVKIEAFVYFGSTIVDVGIWTNTTAFPNWTQISIPITVSIAAVDSVEIIISCGNQTGTSISVDDLSFSPTSGINQSNIKNSFSFFPNPFSQHTTLRTSNNLNNATLVVKNNFGQTVKQTNNVFGNTVTIKRDNLTNGHYFIQVIQDDKIISINKMLIIE